MKTSFKKIISFVLAAAMLVGCAAMLASCGKNYTADNTAFYLGATGPLTGDNAQYGVSVRNGAQLAVDEINAKGGLNGINFYFDMKDDKCLPADAQTGYNILLEDGMQAALGSVTSGACEGFCALAAEDGVFAMSPSASAADIIKDRPTVFRSCFGDPDQSKIAADKIVNEYKYQKIGVIYDSSDTYSKGLYDAFVEAMNGYGYEVYNPEVHDKEEAKDVKTFKVQSFTTENKTSFGTQVDALKECDVIFLPIYADEAFLVVDECVKAGCNAALFGCDGLDGVAAKIAKAGLSVTNAISYITPFDVNSTEEKVASFVNAYKAKYNAEPDQFAAGAYDTVWAIYEAMKKANVTDVTISAADLGAILVDVFTSDDFSYDGVTGNIKWDESGAPTKDPKIVYAN